jgi:hypothetical protein
MIHQKSLKEEGFRIIFGLLFLYNQKKLLFDINGFVKNYLQTCNEESEKEYISAYTTILMSSKREDNALASDLSRLFAIAPDLKEDVINVILKDAHVDSFEPVLKTFLSEITTKDLNLNDHQAKKLLQLALTYNEDARHDSDLIKIYKIIQDRDIIYQNIPAVFQLIEILKRSGFLECAYELLARVDIVKERKKGKFLRIATMLIEESLSLCDLTLFRKHLLPQLESDHEILSDVIDTSLASFISKRSFEDIQGCIETIIELSRLHPSTDDALSSLLSQFIDKPQAMHPYMGMILNLTDQIKDNPKHDQSLSLILVRIAKEGVLEQNRDLIQQTVAISCMIIGDIARSNALSHIIDEVTSLAIRDGDMDLMIRISNWCLEILENKAKEEALQNIIRGLIRFGTERSAINALNVASSKTHEIQNAKARKVLTEACICAYISLGCARFEDPGLIMEPDILEWGLEPFLMAIITLRKGIEPEDRMETLALSTDIILDYDANIDQLSYIIPIILLILEDEDQNNRIATLKRSMTRLNSFSNRIDLNNPYESILLIIRDFPSAQRSKTTLELMKQITGEITKHHSRLMMLTSITKGYLALRDMPSVNQILSGIRIDSQMLNAEEAGELLTESAILYTSFDWALAKECIIQAIQRLDEIPEHASDYTKQKLISAIVTYQERFGQDNSLPEPETILQTIVDPVCYAGATIPLLKIIEDNNKKKELLNLSYKRILSLNIPFDNANLLIDFLSSPDLRIPWEEKHEYIRKAIEISKKINIPFTESVIVQKIILNLTRELSTNYDEQIQEMIIELLDSIEDETRRMNIADELGLITMYERDNNEREMPWTILQKCMINGKRFIDITQIERTLHSINDRGMRARYYLGIAMLLRGQSQHRRVERLIQQAIRDAGVIRPLPRRAFILGDLALTCFSNGEHDYGGEFFDMAMATATNISSSEVREEVFEELDVAMRLIQEIEGYAAF